MCKDHLHYINSLYGDNNTKSKAIVELNSQKQLIEKQIKNNKTECKYGDKCWQTNTVHINKFWHPHELWDNEELYNIQRKKQDLQNIEEILRQYTYKENISAKIFTDKLLEYYNTLDLELQRTLLHQFMHPDYYSIYKFPERQPGPDVPDFAILISLAQHLNIFLEKYGNDFIMNLLYALDEEGLTGTFNYQYKDIISFKQQYYDIYHSFERSGIYNDISVYDKPFSNTLLRMYIGKLDRNHQIRSDKEHRGRSDREGGRQKQKNKRSQKQKNKRSHKQKT